MSNNDFEQFVQYILFNAENNAHENRISKELTYQQAYSIAIRSSQLSNESNSHPTIQQKYMEKQIEVCYDQRKRQKDGQY